MLVLGLVVGTAVTLRKTVWTGSVKQKCLLVLSLLCLVGTSIPIPLEQTSYEMYGGLLSFLFLGLSWARLWAAPPALRRFHAAFEAVYRLLSSPHPFYAIPHPGSLQYEVVYSFPVCGKKTASQYKYPGRRFFHTM